MLSMLGAFPLLGCGQLGVMGPTVCENWVKSTLDKPESYTWTGSHWNSPGPDVNITFTADIDGKSVAHSADCNFIDPDAETLRVDPARSRITTVGY